MYLKHFLTHKEKLVSPGIVEIYTFKDSRRQLKILCKRRQEKNSFHERVVLDITVAESI